MRANVDLNLYAGQQTPYMPKVPEIPICSDALLPEEYWIDQVLDSFSELRLVLLLLQFFS